MTDKHILIIGAGPAGLTAAIELQRSGFTNVTILESDIQVGGISKTIRYKDNRIDIGGHRFFSKSDWVMEWWKGILPIEGGRANALINLRYHGNAREFSPESSAQNNADPDAVMLVRNRLSRIYYNKNFFSYPLRLSLETFGKLGFFKVVKFGVSYALARLRPIYPEKSLEDFFINRFGRKLYLQFFKEYTEKVWGAPCSEISAEWGAQRIKSLSIIKAVAQAIKSAIGLSVAVEQTSLIEHFIYPKYGPGQMWEKASEIFVNNGGTLLTQASVCEIEISVERVVSCTYTDRNHKKHRLICEELISTMPIKDLVEASKVYWDEEVYRIAKNLAYRDFITIGLLYKQEDFPESLQDNWIYIQEPGVQVGRVQVFNNWSPYMVADQNYVWLGLEYFCYDTDSVWHLFDEELKSLAQDEMLKIGLVTSMAQDGVVIKVPKAYPGYFGSAYLQFEKLRAKLDQVENLFLVGRNGMHRYNNQDHSMLTAKEAVSQIISGDVDKDKIWSINIDDEYHEEEK